jgi:glutaminyl-peptide cyclotransferase
MKKKHLKYLYFGILIISLSCTSNNQESNNKQESQIPEIEFELIGTMPHDTTHFIEGLEFFNGKLFESTGSPEELRYTESKAGEINLATGRMNKSIELDKSTYFGEGITILKDKLYQVTYKSKIGFVYDFKTCRKIKQFSYNNQEGWGLTNDGVNIIMSDGTYNLTYFNPENLNVVKILVVKENGYGKENLNELEFIDGFIYANIWKTDQIVKIDPLTGNIVGQINCSSLKSDALNKHSSSLETNGIAYDKTSKTILITGKMWNSYYKIKLR